jgi:hypothetical protein
MKALRNRIRHDSGQAIVFVVAILAVLMVMAALVVDVGSWYQADRQLQTAADAAALAGVQELPSKQSLAKTTAEQYAQHNYAGIPTPAVTFPDLYTIDVVASADTPGIFAPAFNAAFDLVTVRAHAQARILTPNLKNVAPIAVKDTAACIATDPTCFGKTVTVSFDESKISSSAIGLVDLRCQWDSSSVNCGGGPGGDTLGDWIENGYGSALPSNNWYDVKTGVTVGPIKHALDDAANARRALFFPVFDIADGVNQSFHVIGWAAFLIDVGGVDWGSKDKKLTGHFVSVTRADLQYDGGTAGGTDFGVPLIITLTK